MPRSPIGPGEEGGGVSQFPKPAVGGKIGLAPTRGRLPAPPRDYTLPKASHTATLLGVADDPVADHQALVAELDRIRDRADEQLLSALDSVEPATKTVTVGLDILRRIAGSRSPQVRSGSWLGKHKAELAVAALAAAAPISVAISGAFENRTVRMTAEHEIVERNLAASLAEDQYTSLHVRRVAFLSTLADESGVLGDLGRWAQNEHLTTLQKLASDFETTADSYGEALLDHALKTEGLARVRGDYDATTRSWALQGKLLQASEEFRHGESDIANILANRQEVLDAEGLRLKDVRKEYLAVYLLCQSAANFVAEPAAKTSGKDHACNALRPLDNSATELARARCASAPKAAGAHSCYQLGRLLGADALPAAANQVQDQGIDSEGLAAFRKGCDLKDGLACDSLAIWHRLRKEYDSAVDFARKGCTKYGHAKACNTLGWRLFRGEGVAKDPKQARSLFEAGCGQGVLNSCDSLGLWYWYTANQQLDLDKKHEHRQLARSTFQEACENGGVRACINLMGLDAKREPIRFVQVVAVPAPSKGLPSLTTSSNLNQGTRK